MTRTPRTRSATSASALLGAAAAAVLLAGSLIAVPATGRGPGVGTAFAQPVAPVDVPRERLSFTGAPEPHTPAVLNRVDAFRYAAHLTLARPDTVLVLVPGLNSGPNTLDLLARALVSRAPGLEVWVVAPRAGVLQDRRGVVAALANRQPDYVLAYYYGNFPIDGRRYIPLDPKGVPSAAYWGLDLHLRDVRVVVQEVHRRYPGARVLLGGHSLGAILTAVYAGYDFNRNPSADVVLATNGVPIESRGAGFRDIDGLVLIDGVPIRVPFLKKITPAQYEHGLNFPLVGWMPGLDALLNPDPKKRVSPFTDTSALARTQDSILFDVTAVYAYLRPGDASPLPFYPRRGLAITNEALLAAVLSDQMEPDMFIRASLGSPLGRFSTVPDPAGIRLEGLLDLQTGRPVAGQPLIQWIPYNRSTPPGLVDLHALEEAILRPDGDFTQWYMPWRLFLDVGLALDLDTSDAFSRRYASLTQIRFINVPIIVLGAGRGLVRSPRLADFYLSRVATPRSQERVQVFPRYTHLDIEDAVDNDAVKAILDWLPGVPRRAPPAQ